MRNFGTTVRDWRTSTSGDRVVKVGLWTGSPWRYTVTGRTYDRERVRDCGRYHAIRRDKTHIVIALEAPESLELGFMRLPRGPSRRSCMDNCSCLQCCWSGMDIMMVLMNLIK